MEAKEVNCSGNGKPWASPCAACKILRRRCGEKCILAPYFPPDNPHKFSTAHHVFGACNIIKMLKDIPCERRGDAVSSMVYEANARVRDPIYGCAGITSQLQQQLSELQSQLAAAQAELMVLHMNQAELLSLVSIFYASKDEDAKPVESKTEHREINEVNMDGFIFSDEMECLMLSEPR